ncbi:zinc-binding dehydrogenase [Kibdelosporangium lantanae]
MGVVDKEEEDNVRVVEVAEFGGPEVLRVRTGPDPVAGPGQVVVAVEAAGVHAVDTKIRQGLGKPYFTVEPPYVPGAGVAGRVAAVGPDVDGSWVGRAVVAEVSGAYASMAVAAVGDVIPVPEGVGLPDALALLHDGATAWGLLVELPVAAGETVLVQPAAGGLGTILVQLLVGRGARVVGVARESKLGLVKELGADVAVDYSALADVGPVDVAFDGIGGAAATAAFGLVRAGGRFFNYGNMSGSPADVPRDGEVVVLGMERLGGLHAEFRPRAEAVLAEAAAGRIRPVIGGTYPLERAAEAHRALESGASYGKLLLVP